MAIATDTAFYAGPAATTSFSALFNYINTVPVITPINNLLYNTKASNLKAHGLHPHYQHLLVNLPQLLGPALLLLIPYPLSRSDVSIEGMLRNSRLTAAITGSLILSIIPHQEPRFLLPCIPLILTCVQLPKSQYWRKRFWIAWGIFNGFMSILMGVYHQGGITSAQLAMPETIRSSLADTQSKTTQVEVYWWKTYPPSSYMLGAPIHNPNTEAALNINTTPLLGAIGTTLASSLASNLPLCSDQQSILSKFSNVIIPSTQHDVFLAAPFAAFRFEDSSTVPNISNFSFTLPMYDSRDKSEASEQGLRLTHLRTYSKHINLDDMDFGDDGLWPTLSRVVGRRGLGVWRVERKCAAIED